MWIYYLVSKLKVSQAIGCFVSGSETESSTSFLTILPTFPIVLLLYLLSTLRHFSLGSSFLIAGQFLLKQIQAFYAGLIDFKIFYRNFIFKKQAKNIVFLYQLPKQDTWKML